MDNPGTSIDGLRQEVKILKWLVYGQMFVGTVCVVSLFIGGISIAVVVSAQQTLLGEIVKFQGEIAEHLPIEQQRMISVPVVK